MWHFAARPAPFIIFCCALLAIGCKLVLAGRHHHKSLLIATAKDQANSAHLDPAPITTSPCPFPCKPARRLARAAQTSHI